MEYVLASACSLAILLFEKQMFTITYEIEVRRYVERIFRKVSISMAFKVSQLPIYFIRQQGGGYKVITKEMVLSINYYKKAVFTGSQKGMCYLIRKITEEEKNYLEAIWWEGPFNFEKTQKEKHSQKFSFDENGKEKAVKWLNEEYEKNLK